MTAGLEVALAAGFPMLLAWLGTFVWSIGLAIWLIRRKRRLVALICFFIPFGALILSYYAIPYVDFPQNYAHFRAMKPTYDAAVAHLPNNGHRYDEFSWGGMAWSSEAVVYDETDELALPENQRSLQWNERMKSMDVVACGGNIVWSFGDHYYLVGMGC